MSDDQNFRIDLDVRDALGQVSNIRDQIIGLGDSKNLSGLISGFTRLAGPVAIAGAAIFAIKASLDLAQEGEEIEKINRNFDEMAGAAGQAASVLKDGIETSLNGLVDMEDAMKSATKYMYDMGENSAKIPEMFELARKSAKLYGGDTLQNFEKISMAIVNGNTRMLRTIGLNVDAESAQRKYALSIGKTVDSLTAMEKQTALLNAVMDKGSGKFKNIATEGESIAEMLTQVKVAIKEFGDATALMFSKSGFIKETVKGWRNAIQDFTEYMNGKFGTEMQQSAAKVGELTKKLNDLKLQLIESQEREQGAFSKFMFGARKEAFEEELKKRIEMASSELQKAMGENADFAKKSAEETAKAQAGATAQVGGPTPEEIAKQKQLGAAFQRDLLQLKENRIAAELKLETDSLKYMEQLVEQRRIIEAQYDAKINEVKEKSMRGETYTKAQASLIIEQIEAEKAAKIKAIRDQEDEAVMQSYENQVNAAKSAGEGIAAAFAQGAARARKDSQDFGKMGKMTFDSVKNNAVAAFKAMGDGSKSAGEAIKGFLLNSVADYVEMKGQAMLLEGMWPPNPLAIAAGGGLIALSAAMRSAAGGGGGSSAAAGGGGGAMPNSPDMVASKPEPEEQKKKSVTIQVQGNYFETEQTKTRLMEMIRENTDATDFKYQQIGVG